MQPKLDFGPEVISIPELCRTYLPEGSAVAAEDDLNDRWLVARLEARTWEDVRGLLKTGFGVSAEADENGVWQIKADPEGRRLADLALKRVANRVQADAAARLKETGADTNPTAFLDQYAREYASLLTVAESFTLADYAALRQGQLSRINWLTEHSDLGTHYGLLGMSLTAQHGRRTILDGKPFHLKGGPPNLSPLLRIFREQTRGSSPPAANEWIAIRQSFIWNQLAVVSNFFLVGEGVGQKYAYNRGGALVFPGANEEVETVFSMDLKATRTDVTDTPLEWMDEPIPIQFTSGMRGLFDPLLTWAEVDGAEMLAEVHPLTEFLFMSFPASNSLREILLSWATPQERGAQNLYSVSNTQSGEIINDFWLDHFLLRERHDRNPYTDLRPPNCYRSLEITAKDGVLLLTPTAQPLITRIGLPAKDIWPLISRQGLSLTDLRDYSRRISPERHSLWSAHTALRPNFLDAYPHIRAIELTSAKASDEFWETVLAGGQASLPLTVDQARAFYQSLALQGDATGDRLASLPLEQSPAAIIRGHFYTSGSPPHKRVVLSAETISTREMELAGQWSAEVSRLRP